MNAGIYTDDIDDIDDIDDTDDIDDIDDIDEEIWNDNIDAEVKEYHKIYKKIYKYDASKDNLIAVYNNIDEAFHDTGIERYMINRVLTGARKTTGGYVWSYSLLDNS